MIPDDEVADHRSMAALALLQKHIPHRDLTELVERLALILLAGYLSSSQVISLVHYIYRTGWRSFRHRSLCTRAGTAHADALMTIAQQLEQRGIEKGRDEGRQEGRNEGKLEVARAMLQNGIGRNTVMKITGLTEDDLAQICR